MPGLTSIENGMKGGRPKGTKSRNTLLVEFGRNYILNRVQKDLKPIMDTAIRQAKDGDNATRKDLFDRAYGRPKETLEVEGGVNMNIDKAVILQINKIYGEKQIEGNGTEGNGKTNI